MRDSSETLLNLAHESFTRRFAGAARRDRLCSRPGRAARQSHRLQRRPGHRRRNRSHDGVPGQADLGSPGTSCIGGVRRGRYILARRNRADRARHLDPLRSRRMLGTQPVVRPASSRLRGLHRRRCPLRRRPFELGEPSGFLRIPLDRARRSCQAGPAPNSPPRHGDPIRMELAQTSQALGKRVRRGRIGPARPVLEPLRPGRLRALPRLPHAGLRTAPARSARAGDRRLRFPHLAPAGRRHVRPPASRMRSRRCRVSRR